MPCPHFSIKVSTRSKGASAVAQAAYQSGERLFDERSGHTKSYTEKRGIVHTEILLPLNAPESYLDRGTLWNAVEKSETNWNAQLARRIEIALPVELSMEENISLIREYCREQFVSRGMIADIAIHDPSPPGHNPHAHVMLTLRAMDENGKWLPKSRREYALDAEGNRIKDAKGKWKFHKVNTTDWNNRENAELWRSSWETMQNRYLEKANRTERVHMQSYERQGIERIPTVHMGPSVTAMERRGIQTDIGNLNREITQVNVIIAIIVATINLIRQWLSDMLEAIRDLELDPEELNLADLMIKRYPEKENDLRYGSDDFQKTIDYLKSENISNAVDLEKKVSEISAIELPVHEQIVSTTQKIDKIKKLIESGEKKKELDPVRNQYNRIHWKGRKEKFAEAHKEELAAWDHADEFIKKNLPGQQFKQEDLSAELSFLNTRLTELSEKLKPYQKEIRQLEKVQYFTKELIPELHGGAFKAKPQTMTERREQLSEEFAEAVKEAKASLKKTQKENARNAGKQKPDLHLKTDLAEMKDRRT